MANFARNVHFGLRLLLKNPGFTSVALLALVLGIGANTAIFSVVYATLLSPMPYPNPDQLVIVWSKINAGRNGVSAGDFLDWKSQSTVFQSMCAWTGGNFALTGSDHPEMIQTRLTTPGFNDMVGTPFFLGRDFLPEEGQVGKDRVVIMTHRLWMERFGSDRDFIGKDTIKNLWLLMGAVGFILLIACVNVANLLLARGTARQREIAVRAALGATRWQLFGQFLTESVALSLIGDVLGISLAWGLLKVIVAMIPPFTLPSEADFRLNLPVLFFSLAASIVCGVLFGCAPAWQTAQLPLEHTIPAARYR